MSTDLAANFQIKPLVDQITRDRRKSDRNEPAERWATIKEMRITACEELQKILISLRNNDNPHKYHWKTLAEELLSVLMSHVNADVKLAASNCLGSLALAVINEYKDYVKHLLDIAKSRPEKYSDDRAVIFNSIYFSLKEIGTLSLQSNITSETVEEIMTSMKSWLEINESPVVLLSLLDICSAVAQYFPAIFKNSFDDVVDFTIGWYIEPEQSKAVFTKCHETLMSLSPFWFNAVPSAITLMNQFLDDANAYIEEIEKSEPESTLRKSAALVRALSSMVVVMKTCQHDVMFTNFVDTIYGRVLSQLKKLSDVECGTVNNVFEQYIELLSNSLYMKLNAKKLRECLKAIGTIFNNTHVKDEILLKLFAFYEKVVDETVVDPLTNVIDLIVGANGPLSTVDLSHSKIGEAYCNLLGKLFSMKSLPLLQATYSYVTSDIKQNLTTLKAATAIISMETKEFQNRLLLNLCALSKLAIIKISMTMMGLTPSLFSFLVSQTPISEKWFVVNYPDCHYALLIVIMSHSEKHENFSANSVMWINKARSSFIAEAPTANHTTAIFSLATNLLQLDNLMWSITRNVIIDWLNGLVFGVPSDVLNENLDKPEIVKLREALLNSFLRNSLPKKSDACQIMRHKDGSNIDIRSLAGKNRVRHFTLLRRLAVFCMVKSCDDRAKFINSIFEKCRSGNMEKVIGIWQTVPSLLFIQNGLTQKPYDLLEFSQKKIEENMITPGCFTLICNFLFNENLPTYCLSFDSGNWMDSVASVIHNSISKNSSKNADTIIKWRWLYSQIAFFCVENRMKTPLGKTLDTFLGFENAIRRLAVSAISRKVMDAKAKSVESEATRMKAVIQIKKVRNGNLEEDELDDESKDCEARSLTSGEQWWRVRSLIETLELLEKALNYAINGAAFQFARISQTSQQFFITNQTSCMSWLSRLYLPFMAVAFSNGYYAEVVRIGDYALRDIKRRFEYKPLLREKDSKTAKEGVEVSAVHICLSWLVKALIELNGSQPLIGLYNSVLMFDKKREWIKYAAQIADGRIEDAIDGWMNCLNEDGIADNVSKTVRELIVSAISRIRNPEESSRVWMQISDARNKEKNDNEMIPGFDNEAWIKTDALVNFHCFPEDAVQSNLWDIHTSFTNFELKVIRAAQQNSKEMRNEIVESTRQLSDYARMLMVADTSLISHTRASVLHSLITAVKDSQKPAHKQQVGDNFSDLSALCITGNRPVLQHMEIAQQIGSWVEFSQKPENRSWLKITSDEESYFLELSKMARKLGNLRLAKRHLCTHLSTRFPQLSVILSHYLKNVTECSNNHNSNGFDWQMSQNLCIECPLKSAYEAAKLVNAISKKNQEPASNHRAFFILADSVSNFLEQFTVKSELFSTGVIPLAPSVIIDAISRYFNALAIEDRTKLRKIQLRQQFECITLAKSLLRMADWLSEDHKLIHTVMGRSTRFVWHVFAAEQLQLPPSSPSEMASSTVGAMLSTACKLVPIVSKAHLKLGNWSYNSASACRDKNCSTLFTSEQHDLIVWKIKDALPSISDQLTKSIISAIREAHTSENLFAKCSQLMDGTSNEHNLVKLFGKTSTIVDTWKKAKSKEHAYCDLAISDGGSIVLATLRILDTLIQYNDALHRNVINEILQTNELLWKGILPQLFSRLNHPINSVRDTICTILERIACSAPHAVCYPAIVGSMQPVVNRESDKMLNSDMKELLDKFGLNMIDSEAMSCVCDHNDSNLMVEYCTRIVKKLQILHPSLVRDVTEFIQELQRIDMLHEERWIFVLINLDHEMSRIINRIDYEKAKIASSKSMSFNQKKTLTKDKSLILTSLVYRIIEDLYERTCNTNPKTLNEKQFQETYRDDIKQAIKVMNDNRATPRKAWLAFKRLLINLNNRYGKRNLITFQMSEISPQLAKLIHKQIPIPGQESKNFSGVAMLEKIGRQTIVLPTKTRPRKLAFLGSDGKERAFLLKGQEDLHLDERVMQFLRICNFLMARKQTDWPSYTAKNYSVTPLGSRSGLIEWVENSISMFQIYRKWQLQRASLLPQSEDAREVDRPSEIFFKKLRAAFQSSKITLEMISDREKWPFTILKAVVEELIAETPSDIFSKELWLRAGSADTWYRVVERFARSNAVMAMLGSILGLGDRHMDNLLVDLETGHVVHIDYNICFDKGRNLRVPETVPFRLTQNIVNALGPTQIEGTFRLSCENVLKTVRQGKEILSTILDAFVYNPLVDWTAVQNDLASKTTIGATTMCAVYNTDNRKQRLFEMDRLMFSTRKIQYSGPLLKNRRSFEHSIAEVVEHLEKFNEQHSKQSECDISVGVDKSSSDSKLLIAINELRQTVSAHHRIMQDIQPLMRSMEKWNSGLASYLRSHKKFSDNIVKLLELLSKYRAENHTICMEVLDMIMQDIPCIYEDLMTLDAMPEDVTKQLNGALDDGNSGDEPIKQKENVHGRHLVTCVQRKLEGLLVHMSDKSNSNRSMAENESLFIEEQVDLLIRQATDINNLALMYEGWTAWV